MLQFRLAALQVLGHPVERVHERADLVRGLDRNPDVQIALRDGLGRLRQPLNRHRDTTRDIEPEPRGAEENQHRDHRDEEIGPSLDGILHRFNLLVGLVLSADPLHLG